MSIIVVEKVGAVADQIARQKSKQRRAHVMKLFLIMLSNKNKTI